LKVEAFTLAAIFVINSVVVKAKAGNLEAKAKTKDTNTTGYSHPTSTAPAAIHLSTNLSDCLLASAPWQ